MRDCCSCNALAWKVFGTAAQALRDFHRAHHLPAPLLHCRSCPTALSLTQCTWRRACRRRGLAKASGRRCGCCRLLPSTALRGPSPARCGPGAFAAVPPLPLLRSRLCAAGAEAAPTWASSLNRPAPPRRSTLRVSSTTPWRSRRGSTMALPVSWGGWQGGRWAGSGAQIGGLCLQLQRTHRAAPAPPLHTQGLTTKSRMCRRRLPGARRSRTRTTRSRWSGAQTRSPVRGADGAAPATACLPCLHHSALAPTDLVPLACPQCLWTAPRRPHGAALRSTPAMGGLPPRTAPPGRRPLTSPSP